MAFRDILVHVDARDSGKARLRLAADLAFRHAARLSALHVREHSMAQERRLRKSELGLVPGSGIAGPSVDIQRELDADTRDLRDLLQQLQHDYALTTQWLSLDGRAHVLVPQRARYADLSIVGHDLSQNPDLPDEYSFAETMIFTSGRPLIIVPSREQSANDIQKTLGEHIALCWNGSRASARALTDAMPLVEKAQLISVLLVDADDAAHAERVPVGLIIDQIGLHTAHVTSTTLTATGKSIAQVLQEEALRCGADLLVAGAHGRPRLWEKMLGGVTRDLLSQIRLPLLMAH